MTNRERDKIINHLEKAYKIFERCNKDFCQETCIKCTFTFNAQCFMLNELPQFIAQYNRKKKHVIPNVRRRRPEK